MSEIVKEYGKALYVLSEEEGLEPQFLGEIRIIRSVIGENRQFISLLSAPNIPKDDRMASVDRVFGERIHKYLCSFMKLMVKRDHAKYIPECLDEYERLWYEKSGIVLADVTSAVALSRDQKNRLHARLEEYTGKSVEMTCSVDPSIIGGVTVTIDGKRIDGSVRSHIDTLKKRIQTKTI